ETKNVSFGVNPDATDGIDDGLDVTTEDFPPVLPPAGQPHLHVAFEGPDMRCLSTDIRPAGPWTLVVYSSDRFTLTWDTPSVPDYIPLFLDPGDGSPIINMGEQDSQDFIKGISAMTIDIDTTPPSPVTNFTALNPTENTIDLTWTNPLDGDFAGTLIVRSQETITWAPTEYVNPIDQVVPEGVIVCYTGAGDHSTIPFIDTGLEPYTIYYYRAFAYDILYNYSSGEETSDTTVPVTLSLLTAASSGNRVIFRWRTETETNNLGFNICRSDKKDGKYVKVNAKLIQGAGSDATPHDYSFTDDNVKFGQTYYYYIEDVDFAGKKGKSPIFQITVGQESEVKVIDKPNITIRPKPKPIVIPTEFALLQNYPNPFNPETWLPYELAKDAMVTIHIYDVKGQLVRQLNIGKQEVGSYINKDKAAYWDGKDGLGQAVSSGIYFYALSAGDFKATKRMVIVK
ncbi:T9SS type A sorting domain-containing protein, partial [bacterium]|nr:T9SS type A sorting domain-containing protein [bacterium]